MELTKEIAQAIAQAAREETIKYNVGEIPAIDYFREEVIAMRDAVWQIETPFAETPITALKSLIRAGVFDRLAEQDRLTLFNVFEYYFVLVRLSHRFCLLGSWLDSLVSAIDQPATND